MSANDFPGWMTAIQHRTETALEARLPEATLAPQTLHEAMRYAVLEGGKRVRALLTHAAGELTGADPAALDAAACAVELIHAYSLVHDDMPCMDDDVLRRGKPTVHVQFGEATALLTGDALQTQAFQCLTEPLPGVASGTQLEMVALLALASGSRGMAGGQAIDLASVGKALTREELEYMHIHKTGALIRASVLLGALSAPGVDMPRFEALDRYAKSIGLAFQIQDDILDVEGDSDETGKAVGADAQRDKPTYPALLGMDAAKNLAAELIDTALESLSDFDARADVLRGIAQYVVNRRH